MNPQKFLFDRCFDTPATIEPVAPKVSAPEPVVEPIQEEPVKTYEDGFKDGFQNAEATLRSEFEQQMQATQQELEQAALHDTLQQSFIKLLKQEERLENYLSQASIQVATNLVKHLFPEWSKQHAQNEVTAVLKRILAQTEHEKRLILRTHPDDISFMQQTAQEILQDFALQAELVVKSAPELKPGDIKIRWAGGGAEYLPQQLLEQITNLSNQLTPEIAEQQESTDHE